MTAALEMRGVTPSQKLLLIALANYANEDGQCWPSQARLARDTCLSDRTVRTVLVDLKKAGLIEVDRRLRPDGSATTSIITLIGLRRPVATTTPPEIISAPPGNGFPTPPEATSYLTTFEPPLEPSRELVCVTREPDFDDFWSVYPNKQAKAAARKAFTKAIAKTDAPTLIAAVERQRVWDQWQRGFIPHPATWLNAERWNDEPPPENHAGHHDRTHRPDPKFAAKQANLARAFAGAERVTGPRPLP